MFKKYGKKIMIYKYYKFYNLNLYLLLKSI